MVFLLEGHPVAMSTRVLKAVLKESRAVGEEEIRVQIQDRRWNHQKPTTNHPSSEICLFFLAVWLMFVLP